MTAKGLPGALSGAFGLGEGNGLGSALNGFRGGTQRRGGVEQRVGGVGLRRTLFLLGGALGARCRARLARRVVAERDGAEHSRQKAGQQAGAADGLDTDVDLTVVFVAFPLGGVGLGKGVRRLAGSTSPEQ